MTKPKNSYSDAMNEWAAKQSNQRKRGNRFVHPNPDKPGALRALGYLARIAIVLFVVWVLGSKLSTKYYNGEGFNEQLRAEIRELSRADEIESTNFYWSGGAATCKKLTAQGGASAFYRYLEASQLSFDLPLVKRLRRSWTIDQLNIGTLALELKPGTDPMDAIGAAKLGAPPFIGAGLLPSPDFSKLTISRVTCDQADFVWGQSDLTLGGLEGASFDLFSGSPDWQMDVEGGVLRQNWLRGLAVRSMTLRRKGEQLLITDAELSLGRSEALGTLEGQVTLGEEPQLQLQLEFPSVDTRDLLPDEPDFPDYFEGIMRLSAAVSGSTSTRSGVAISGKATLSMGTFSKIPVFEAIDKLLKSSSFRIFSPDAGELEFETGGGMLRVTKFECRSRSASAMLRGEFVYTPASTLVGGKALGARSDKITGQLQLGVRPARLAGKPLAKTYFHQRADGYAWIDIPLDGPLEQATKEQQAEILAALRAE